VQSALRQRCPAAAKADRSEAGQRPAVAPPRKHTLIDLGRRRASHVRAGALLGRRVVPAEVGDGGRWWEMVGDGGRWREMAGDGGRWSYLQHSHSAAPCVRSEGDAMQWEGVYRVSRGLVPPSLKVAWYLPRSRWAGTSLARGGLVPPSLKVAWYLPRSRWGPMGCEVWPGTSLAQGGLVPPSLKVGSDGV
jgi:hypothetical protein